MKYYVQKKETSNGNFYFVDWGIETHDRTSFRLWVHHSLIKKDEKGKTFLIIPQPNVSLLQGKSAKTLILRPGSSNLYDIFVVCGYHGISRFQILTPVEAIFKYYVFESPRGRTGISEGALVTTEQDIHEISYKWERTGRLYGAPAKGTTTIFIDKKVEEFEGTDLL